MTHVLKLTPISVKKTSRFLPLRFCFAASLTFARVAQHASHGSVLPNESSSLRGLNSFFFCLDSWRDSQATIAESDDQRYECFNYCFHSQSANRFSRAFAAPSILLTV